MHAPPRRRVPAIPWTRHPLHAQRGTAAFWYLFGPFSPASFPDPFDATRQRRRKRRGEKKKKKKPSTVGCNFEINPAPPCVMPVLMLNLMPFGACPHSDITTSSWVPASSGLHGVLFRDQRAVPPPACTATSTSFWTMFRAFLGSAPPRTRCGPCSTWCPRLPHADWC